MDINKLRKEHQKHVKLIEELQVRVNQADANKRIAVEEATRAMQEEVDALETEIAKLKKALADSELAGATRIDELNMREAEYQASVAKLIEQTDRQRAELVRADERIKDLVRQINDFKPTLELKEKQIADLTKLLKKVEDRMKRKELEEQQAILNRRALAGADQKQYDVTTFFGKKQ